MDESTIFWSVLVISLMLFATFAGTVWFLSRLLRQSQETLRNTQEMSTEGTRALSELLDKALGMLGTKDPLAFQQVQAMSSATPSGYDPYDPSDEAEVARIKARDGGLSEEDDLSGEERSLLDDFGGVDPFFQQ